jgi:hypothetical protein
VYATPTPTRTPNNKPLRKRHLKKIRANGIEIFEYKPLKFPWVHAVFNRDHRKILLLSNSLSDFHLCEFKTPIYAVFP